MSKAPAMPMYWDAYLADTTHLTTEEHGAYMLLLAAMWRRNAWVPDDDKDNARILGLTPAKWRRIKARLMETVSGFHVKDGKITQEKLQKTWENTQEKIGKNRSNGAKGGRPKSKENKDMAKANGSVSVNPNQSIPEPEPEPEPDIRIEDTNVSLSVSTDAPCPANDISHAVSRYNQAAERAGWPQVQKLTPNRSKQLRARLKDCGGLEGWEDALRRAYASDFCRGRTPKPWTGFGFDWLTKAANFTKLMEGNYDNRSDNPTATGGNAYGNKQSASFASIVARRRNQQR
jgi:uncharacterized protein YdaU (DUF1376 family)